VFCKGRWFAVFPVESAVKDNYSSSVIALDPGIRTFMTGFDSQKFLEFGNGDMGRITRLCQHLDGLMGKIAKAPNGKKRPMRKAAQRLRNKIKNLVNECHKKVACFLTKNYRVIFLPKFETSQMVARAGRKLSSKTARKMLTWTHYRFKMELKHQASLRNCQVVDVTEEYTSKICTKCGKIHLTLGGSKIFSCKSCGNTLPRDFNGALGIMLKALRDTSSVVFNGDSAIVKLSGNALESPA
jgi:putative transposase